MSDPAAIRRADVSDLEAIVELRLEFERITRDSGTLDEAARRAELGFLLGADLRSGRLLAWIAEDGERAVAQAALRLSDPGGRAPAGAPRTGELLNVYTRPDYRGQGLGSALVAAAIEEARGRGLRRLSLQPTEDSRRIYERLGFRAQGRAMVLDPGLGAQI